MIILGHFWQRFIMDVGNLLQKNKNLIYLSIIYIHLDIRSSGKLPLYDVTFVLPTSFTTKNEKNFHVTKNYSCYYLVLGSLIITWWTKKKKKELDRDRTRTCNPQIRSLVPYPERNPQAQYVFSHWHRICPSALDLINVRPFVQKNSRPRPFPAEIFEFWGTVIKV